MSLIENHFEKFYKKILLTPKQQKDAQKKYTGVCETLHNHYYETKYAGKTKLLFGSYGKSTNIRPPRDVDVLFKMPESEFDRYDEYESNGQSQLLQDIKTILNEKYVTTDEIKGWGKVILIEFADGTHNVDILPSWSSDDKIFLIPNSEEGGSWEEFDPVSEITRINDSEQKTGITRKLIRMIKKWDDNCTVEIKSCEIEKYVLDFFDSYLHDDKLAGEIVRDFFKHLKNEVDRNQKSHVETAYNRAEKACEYEFQEKYDEAIGEWRKIFGDDFPRTIKRIIKSYVDEIFYKWTKKYPSEKEKFLDKDYGIPFKINEDYDFKIDVIIPRKGFRNHYLSHYLLKGWSLYKGRQLKFRVIKNNVPRPYEIKWKVRNYGDEAIRDLRGEITDDNGSESKNEHTEYKGSHYVECYCIKNGACVAMDHIEVPIGEDYEE